MLAPVQWFFVIMVAIQGGLALFVVFVVPHLHHINRFLAIADVHMERTWDYLQVQWWDIERDVDLYISGFVLAFGLGAVVCARPNMRTIEIMLALAMFAVAYVVWLRDTRQRVAVRAR